MKTRIFDWAQKVDYVHRAGKTRLVMVTLTYRASETYQPGHIGDYLKNLKKRLKENLYAFAWVAELQRRGEVHYHVILLVKKGSRIPKPDQRGYWTHGMSKIETARTAYYLATYTGKEYQKNLAGYPKSCRLYAVSIRPSMGLPSASCGQIGGKKHHERDAEGGPVWSCVGTAVESSKALEYLDLVASR